MLTKQNAEAYAILSIIFRELTDEELTYLHIEPYLNGRESGFAVQFYARSNKADTKVVFCENRRSDDLVLYKAKTHQFSMQGNGLDEEIYANSKWFLRDQYVEAARQVICELRATTYSKEWLERI